MRSGITFEVTAADRTRLEAITADRNRPQKHFWRANIILLSGAGCGTAEIMRRTGKAKTCIWQERYIAPERGRSFAGQDPTLAQAAAFEGDRCMGGGVDAQPPRQARLRTGPRPPG